jgi:hypothetical protein
MPKYLIERHIPGAGNLLPEELRDLSASSSKVLSRMGPEIQWVLSYVTADRFYCLYIAPDEAVIREHARLGGFPANRILEIKSEIRGQALGACESAILRPASGG